MPRGETGGGGGNNNKGADKYLFEGGVLHTNKQCCLLISIKIYKRAIIFEFTINFSFTTRCNRKSNAYFSVFEAIKRLF